MPRTTRHALALYAAVAAIPASFLAWLILLGRLARRGGHLLRLAISATGSGGSGRRSHAGWPPQRRADAEHPERALLSEDEQYRLIAENTTDLISLIDQTGRCVYASPSHCGVLGYDPADLLGGSPFCAIHPDDAPRLAEGHARLEADGTAQVVFRCRHASGEWRWLEVVFNITIRQHTRYVVTVGRDITDRKRLEAQLFQAQKMEGVGRLAGGIAHDFNNLLTALNGYAELARGSLPPDHPAHSDIAEILSATHRAADLTRQLLAFARKQIIAPQMLNLNDLILDVDKLLRRLIGEDIELVTLPATDLGIVKADPGQIEQVLINLAVNARDAMPSGGTLLIETANVTLDERYVLEHVGAVPGTYAMLAVSDTGTGMGADVLRHLFEPFFTTKEPGKGTGLGLATCYGIVKQHGGYIWADSVVGQGSTFKVYLPCADMPPQELPRPASDRPAPRGTETVLVVEDEVAVRDLIVRVLRIHGYSVLESPNGEAALALVQDWVGPIDLLLTDLIMPQLGGEQLAERLTRARPGIKVLFISGYTDSAIILHGRMDSGRHFLHKPFASKSLVDKVREVLDSEAV